MMEEFYRADREGDVRENQATDGRRHTPIVNGERKAEIERDCTAIAKRLRAERNAT
jgi:hypothetical protein